MVYVFLANGFEEVEALAPVDILRRADVDVKTVGVGSEIIRGAHGIPVITDLDANEIELNENIEMIVLPGGMPGTVNLEKNENVQKAIDYCIDNNKYISAICAAPSILGHKGILDGKTVTCFPGFEKELGKANYSHELVVNDGKITTARGAGAAIKFGLKLVELLVSKEKSEALEASLQCK